MTLRFITAAGSPAEIGLAHGAGTADQIAGAIAFYKSWAKSLGTRWEELIEEAEPFMDAARERAPRGVEELEGMARGAGAPFEDLVVLNCIEEVWPEDVEACTSAINGRFLLHAEQWTAGHRGVVVLTVEPADGTPFVSPTCAGFLPAVGLSAAGFALGVDSLTAADDTVGVPRCLVARAALGASSVEEALAAVTMPGRSGGYGYVIASPHGSSITETSASTCVTRLEEAVHTNHYLFSDPSGGGSKSHSRLNRARELMEGSEENLDWCKRFLSDHANAPESICAHPERDIDNSTIFGMVCDTVAGDVFVSDGYPCGGVWERATVPGYRPAPRRVGA